MKKNEMMSCGKKCILYLNEYTEYILIQPVDENDISVLDNEVKHRVSFTAVAPLAPIW